MEGVDEAGLSTASQHTISGVLSLILTHCIFAPSCSFREKALLFLFLSLFRLLVLSTQHYRAPCCDCKYKSLPCRGSTIWSRALPSRDRRHMPLSSLYLKTTGKLYCTVPYSTVPYKLGESCIVCEIIYFLPFNLPTFPWRDSSLGFHFALLCRAVPCRPVEGKNRIVVTFLYRPENIQCIYAFKREKNYF